jgi:hypothetical protein
MGTPLVVLAPLILFANGLLPIVLSLTIGKSSNVRLHGEQLGNGFKYFAELSSTICDEGFNGAVVNCATY